MITSPYKILILLVMKVHADALEICISQTGHLGKSNDSAITDLEDLLMYSPDGSW